MSAGIEVATLLRLGLDESLARVWKAMAEMPGIGVEGLSRRLEISESELRGLLDALADRSLIRASQRTPGLLLPISAEAALTQLIRGREEDLAERQRRIRAQRAEISRVVEDRLDADDAASRPDGQIEHLIGPDEIHARFEEIAYTTTTSVDSVVAVAELPARMLADAWPLDADLLRRGVKFRSLYVEAIRDSAPLAAYARALQQAGAEVRINPTLPHRIFVSDRRVAVVPLDPVVRSRGVAIVKAAGVIALLEDLFEAIWLHAAPLDAGKAVDAETGLSDTERTLLTMLAGGSTDEAAAEELGVSLRTVRRIMADLMQRLDAGSRFEAGIKAAKRGWL
jgi:DNA-binding CsgD family transcriptional regulator